MYNYLTQPIRSSRMVGILLATLLLTACQPTAQPSAPVGVTPTVVAEAIPTAMATVAITETPVSPPSGSEVATPAEDPFVLARRIVEQIGANAPVVDGWQVQPCEGMAPALCVRSGEENVGYAEVNLFPLDTMTDFLSLLAEQGLEINAIDPANALYQQHAVPALREFVANHLATIEEDRQITFGDRLKFSTLATEESNFGPLPGVYYGFLLTDADGKVVERNINFAAFDADYVYIISAFYMPGHESAFASDEALTTFEPLLRQIVAALQLPASAVAIRVAW
jgi:hypothetical protein